MNTTGPTETAMSESRTSPQDIANLNKAQEELPFSTPLEMSSLEAPPPAPSILAHEATAAPVDPIVPPAMAPSQIHPTTTASSSFGPGPVSRTFSTAIGPSTDTAIPTPSESSGPSLIITLLLTSGARHPFKLDSKYLAKRNVEVPGNDPFNLSVYKLKELILREWREEWELKPVSPSYIRLISFGKLLDDKSYLKDSKLNHDAPNVVHMTIKPQDYIEDEDAKAGKGSFGGGRDGTERSPGCRCVIM